MPTRREFLWLLLLARCAAPERVAVAESDGRFTARPLVKISTGGATPQPEALKLGGDRDGVFYVPAKAVSSHPLLVYLHGAGGSGSRVMQYLTGHADDSGTIVIAPDSREQTWGALIGDEAADVAFINAALQKVFERYSIDPARIGIGGFSDGATAALSWGLVNGDLFSAIVAFSPGGLGVSSDPVGKPRVFISHGIDDEILPIDRSSRQIVPVLREAGYTVDYREFDGDHDVPGDIGEAGLAFLLK